MVRYRRFKYFVFEMNDVVKLMKKQLKKIVRRMKKWPVVGRFVHIGIAVFRLPQLFSSYLDLNHRHHLVETQQLPTLLSSYLDLDHRRHILETQQLPTLLQTLSEINHRLLVIENDKENLAKSVPVVLREFARELADTRSELKQESKSINQRSDETDGKLKHLENLGNLVHYLFGRVEFVRRELMYEMRYGASPVSGSNEQIKTETEILSVEKLAAARVGKLRLNLGCGHILLDGYLNIDRRALPGVDVVAEVDELPFESDEVDEIFSSHLLEHFPQEQLRRELLPYFYKLLKPGGVFQAVVPDGEEMTRRAASDPSYFDSFRFVTYGGQDYDGDFHFNMFSPESLSKLLSEAGFVNIDILYQARQNTICYEFEIKAFKRDLQLLQYEKS